MQRPLCESEIEPVTMRWPLHLEHFGSGELAFTVDDVSSFNGLGSDAPGMGISLKGDLRGRYSRGSIDFLCLSAESFRLAEQNICREPLQVRICGRGCRSCGKAARVAAWRSSAPAVAGDVRY